MADPYFAYVAGAYALVFGTIAALIGWTIADRAAARRALARAERAANRSGGAARAR